MVCTVLVTESVKEQKYSSLILGKYVFFVVFKTKITNKLYSLNHTYSDEFSLLLILCVSVLYFLSAFNRYILQSVVQTVIKYCTH